MKKSINKYQAGLAAAASGTAGAIAENAGISGLSGSSFKTGLDKFGAPILAATSTIANLINANKKQDPTGKPYKNGTNMIKTKKNKLIKYQNGDENVKAKKVLPDSGSSFVITMDDLADSALNAQAQGQTSSNNKTSTSETTASTSNNKTTSKQGLSSSKQAGISASAGALGGLLREYGKKGGSKTRNAAKYVGEAIKWLAPAVSVGESIRKNIDTKTGDINYSGALGQMFLDQAAGKIGKAAIRIPFRTLQKSEEQSKIIQEDIARRGVTKEEYKTEKNQYRQKEKEAKSLDKSLDEKNLINYNKKLDTYNKKMAERVKKKTRGQAPKPPVKPEPVTINQQKLLQSDKPYLKYGPRVDITPTSEFAKQASIEEFKIPFLTDYLKRRKEEKQYIAEGKALDAKSRALQINEENKKKFRILENTFGLDERNFMGQLRKSGMSFEDFYQTKLNEFKNKGQKISEQRQARRETNERRKQVAQQQRFSPERKEQARQNLQRKAQSESERNLIKFNESERARINALKESFRENKPSLGYSVIQRTRMPAEDITPTPRKSILLLPESSAAKRKATRAANAATKQATEQRVEGKVKKIKFYGTGNP